MKVWFSGVARVGEEGLKDGGSGLRTLLRNLLQSRVMKVWFSGVARVGEEGARGWRFWVESTSEETLPTQINEGMIQWCSPKG